ncbi:MAG: MBL fold metallo-hydrolase [Clostridiales bacterium]|nr:MBL fold metallo-hydrolase [Clostridiales bacterium]
MTRSSKSGDNCRHKGKKTFQIRGIKQAAETKSIPAYTKELKLTGVRFKFVRRGKSPERIVGEKEYSRERTGTEPKLTDMQYKTLTVGNLNSNCYLVKDESGMGFIVDPGGEPSMIEDEARAFGLTPLAVLLTHGHFDHTNAAYIFQERGVPVYIHKDDEDKLHSYRSLSLWAGIEQNKITADVTLSGKETLRFGALTVKVIHTPGHSAGGLCFKIDSDGGDRTVPAASRGDNDVVCSEKGLLFTGDTMFKIDYGRYDFYDGDFKTLKNSIINKLFSLKGDYIVLPGHGEASTLEEERKFNPILIDSGL